PQDFSLLSAYLAMTREAPTLALVPYTTLFRSSPGRRRSGGLALSAAAVDPRRATAALCAAGQRGPPRRNRRRPRAPACFARFRRDRKSTRLNSSHLRTSYAAFCIKKIFGCSRR